ncbi:ASCH domain-containing protein [Proteiniphilum sp. UBA5463]|uniref:ASCH domain-containing protein n=1 Tax=Proteiniphilum sp. UBA5463 TaxID=1947281 RepID=UPI00257B7D93|nr:ASCH domain-containing protein [Proteiniphilum sp. UBA5463]
MKTISLRQPWAFLICSGIKDIENRTWKLPEKYKGERVLIHASRTITFGQFCNYIVNLDNEDLGLQKIVRENCFRKSWLYTLETSAIIGSVEIVDCVLNHPSIWAEKTDLLGLSETYYKIYSSVINVPPIIHNWVLANQILFDKPILNVKGKLGFWDYDLPEEYETILKI